MDDLKRVAYFFNSHPGTGGAIVALPEPMLDVAQSLDCTRTTLEDAVKKMNSEAKLCNGNVEVLVSSIRFSMKLNNQLHVYRLLDYEFCD